MTSRGSLLAALVAIAGCDICRPSTYDAQGYASAQDYGGTIAECRADPATGCDALCINLFSLTPDQTIERCTILSLDASGGATVAVRYDDTSTCASDGWFDGTYDDGSTDDGYYGDGGDSGDDGGDSGDSGDDGGDGGGDRRAPHTTPAREARGQLTAPRAI